MDFEKWFLGALALAAVFLSAALLIVGAHHSGQLLQGAVLLVFQILLALTAAFAAYLFIAVATPAATRHLVSSIAYIRNTYPTEIRVLRQSQPAALAVTAVIGDAALLVADKVFPRDAEVIAVSVLLIAGFAMANGLIASEQRLRHRLGLLAWFVVLLYLPISAFLLNQMSWHALLAAIGALSLRTQILTGLAFALLLIAPFAAEADA